MGITGADLISQIIMVLTLPPTDNYIWASSVEQHVHKNRESNPPNVTAEGRLALLPDLQNWQASDNTH